MAFGDVAVFEVSLKSALGMTLIKLQFKEIHKIAVSIRKKYPELRKIKDDVGLIREFVNIKLKEDG
jgi:hypothetical protein